MMNPFSNSPPATLTEPISPTRNATSKATDPHWMEIFTINESKDATVKNKEPLIN